MFVYFKVQSRYWLNESQSLAKSERKLYFFLHRNDDLTETHPHFEQLFNKAMPHFTAYLTSLTETTFTWGDVWLLYLSFWYFKFLLTNWSHFYVMVRLDLSMSRFTCDWHSLRKRRDNISLRVMRCGDYAFIVHVYCKHTKKIT